MSRINFLKHVFTGTASDNTAEGAIIRAGGKHAEKTITLSANNTTDAPINAQLKIDIEYADKDSGAFTAV